MAQRVVDALEVVKVDAEQGQRTLVPLANLQGACESMAKVFAIGQARQRIEVSEPTNSPLRRLEVPYDLVAAQQIADAMSDQRPADRLGDEVRRACAVRGIDRRDIVHACDHDDG